MTIEQATPAHLEGVNRLLYQVADVHRRGRPDLFRADAKKYNDNELCAIFENESTPVFVALDDDDTVLGYAFCIIEEIENHPLLMDDKSLYIDDLCVEENRRGQHIGKALLEFVRQYAKSIRCRRITLNVWECNPSAMAFYRKNGFLPLKTGMEELL